MVAFLFAFPALAWGQTVSSKDLVGTWVEVDDRARGATLTLNADGSYSRAGKEGRWKLTEDTLQLHIEEYNPQESIVRLRGRRLLFWSPLMWEGGRDGEPCAESVYERSDPSGPPPSPLPPSSETAIDPVDLVGTWAGSFESSQWGVVTDSLFIGADYTIKVMHLGPSDDVYITGTWALLPGNWFKGAYYFDPIKIYMQNGDLVRCHQNYPILKRVGP